MKKKGVIFVMIFAAILSASCGQNGESKYNDAGEGSAKLVVHNSKALVGEDGYKRIKLYRVSISGPGIDLPIEVEFSGDAEYGVVDGIPSGNSRVVAVTAVNSQDKAIRFGESGDVNVSGGRSTEVNVDMAAIPIFTNLNDGNVIKNNRLRFELFSDPEDSLTVEELIDDGAAVLPDINSNMTEVVASVDTGTAVMVPPVVSPGEHKFKVTSNNSGLSSTVKIKVLDGEAIEAAPVFSGGSYPSEGDNSGVSRVGNYYYTPAPAGVVSNKTFGPEITEYK